MIKNIGIFLVICALSFPVFAQQNLITSNFYAVPNSTLKNTATTSSQIVTFSQDVALAAPDIMIKNGGAVTLYCDYGVSSAGGGSFTGTTVPTNTVPGGWLINPGEADIFNKRNADSVACIASSSTAIFSATPGRGN